jgi:hypothetical protein
MALVLRKPWDKIMTHLHHVPEDPDDDYTHPDWVFPLDAVNTALGQRGFAEVQSQSEGLDREHDICVRISMRNHNQLIEAAAVEKHILDIVDHIERGKWKGKCCVACVAGQQVSAKVIVRYSGVA